MKRTYLDHIAATPLRPEVFEAMRPFLTDVFGNPQSLHAAGQEALTAVDAAREEVAALIGATASEIYFTATGSEANNFAVKGMAAGQQARGRHIVVSAVEHTSVLSSVKALERVGLHVDRRSRRPDGPGRSGRGRQGPNQGDGPRLRHDGQQRGRDDRACG